AALSSALMVHGQACRSQKAWQRTGETAGEFINGRSEQNTHKPIHAFCNQVRPEWIRELCLKWHQAVVGLIGIRNYTSLIQPASREQVTLKGVSLRRGGQRPHKDE